MTDNELREALERTVRDELAVAVRTDGTGFDTAMAYYNGELPAQPEGEGKTGAVSTDVADMTNSVLAMLTPMLSTDAVVTFEPHGEDDEAQAQMESLAVNSVIMEDNNGFIEIQEAIKDGLQFAPGALRVDVVDEDEIIYHSTLDQPPEQIAALLEVRSPYEERTYDKDRQRVKVQTRARNFIIRAVPTENLRWRAGWLGTVANIPFIAERMEKTRSDLIDLGVKPDVVAGLQPYAGGVDSNFARTREYQQDNPVAPNTDQDIIECFDCWVLFDGDGDGVSERYRVLSAGEDTLLMYDEVELVPLALGSPFIAAHTIRGESLYQHIRPTQDVKTELVRQMLDNVVSVNNGRYIYDPDMTSEADVLKPRPGGGIRSRDPANSVVPLMVPDVTSGILAALAYQDQIRTERGGASLDMMSADTQLVGETAHGLERQYASRELLASMMAANLAEGMIRQAYRLMHEYLRRFSNRPMMVKQSGQYLETDPRTWPKRTRLNADIGLSPGQRGHLQAALSQHIQLGMAAMQAGGAGQLVDFETMYRTQMDNLRLGGAKNPERYMIDPTSPKAAENQQKAEQATQMAQQEQQAMTQRAYELELRKLDNDLKVKMKELEWKYYDTNVDAEVKGMDIGIKAEQVAAQIEQGAMRGPADGAAGISPSQE